MYCPRCGCENVEGAFYCKKCGCSLNNAPNNQPVYTPPQRNSSSTKNLLIIAITVLIITLIVAGTLIILSDNNNDGSIINNIQKSVSNNQSSDASDTLNVNQVTFYSDGNPNTGESATINVGKEHFNEDMEVKTTYSRDGVNFNNPDYEYRTVDADGNISITDYTPMNKYPDYCLISIRYNDKVYQFGCDIGKYKGTQSTVPRAL